MPAEVINDDPNSKFYHHFKDSSCGCAERGFIVFAPRNPYYCDDRHRGIQRHANPLGKSIFSIIIAQHDAILDWLGTLPNVDPARIGFYGLSYGGKTAMRVPKPCSSAMRPSSARVISTMDLEERDPRIGTELTVTNNTRCRVQPRDTYILCRMAALIAPRPFMVNGPR